tara:strand:+ start:76 stop:306 length:231 start_codon:yes stop_codon:yes gene_type:complete
LSKKIATKQVNVRIPQHLWLNFKEVCEKNESSVSQVLREYITYYVSHTIHNKPKKSKQPRDLREAWLPPEQRKGGR